MEPTATCECFHITKRMTSMTNVCKMRSIFHDACTFIKVPIDAGKPIVIAEIIIRVLSM